SNTYNVNVTSGAFANQNFAVWIDYNDDNDFYDAGELIGYSSAATTAGYQTISFSINLACTPPFGTHRMRIRDAFATTASTMDPCATYGWGETEDYLITIVAGTPFAPAFTATPSTPNCVGAQVTYTATAGQTNYAWTFPGTAGVDYTLVSGGTSASNTAVVTYNTSGSNTITMNYASPLGCASSGAINNTITVGAGTFTTTAVAGDVIWRGASSTDWSTTSNWYSYNGTSYAVASGLPSPATRTIIPANNSCVLAQPAVNVAIAGSAKDVIIESGATLTMTTGTLNVSGNFVNNGTFVAGTGTVVFNTAATVSGNATTFNNVDLNNGVNFGSNLSTINGVMTMNTGSWVNTNAPIYGTSSLLRYNTGGAYGRGFEWSTTSGAGYPNDVQVSGLTTINYPNTGGAFSTNLGVRRDLTIDAGSNVYMDYGTGNASGSLTVGRNVTSAGDLSLGNQIGGDIYVGGNWTRTTGNFYANNRAVFFNGATGAQTITKSGGETFPFMIVNKASGNVVLANNVTVSGGLTLTNGLVEVGTNNMVMGGASLTGGSSASYVKTESTGVLSRNVGGTATTFPVGNGTYNPAMVTNTGIADIFTIRVIDNVTANGTGVGATTTEAVVNRTWMIDEATAGGTNATLRLFWNGAGEEINAFSAATAFMAHYVAAASLWDNIGGTVGAGYVETSNNTSFSPFTISSSTTFAPLPVELISLGAQCANEDVIVSWSTASEHNSLNFIVERSENGLNWNEVQTVTAAVNSNTVREYAIEDAGAARGLKYYRLIQTDQDGAQKVYGPVMSNCGSDADMFMSFPNPSDADITLVFNSKKINGSTTLMVRDAHGRVVRSMSLEIQPGTDSMLIPDMELTPGVYYLQLEGESFKTPVIKHSLR
ncbi:MAG: GEVED domain-containing protein, partial [Flavobacteriia bacterium]